MLENKPTYEARYHFGKMYDTVIQNEHVIDLLSRTLPLKTENFRQLDSVASVEK